MYQLYPGTTHEFFGTYTVVPLANDAQNFAATLLKAAFQITFFLFVLPLFISLLVSYIKAGQDANGEEIKLHYTDQGQGAPVVLIHGWPQSQEA